MPSECQGNLQRIVEEGENGHESQLWDEHQLWGCSSSIELSSLFTPTVNQRHTRILELLQNLDERNQIQGARCSEHCDCCPAQICPHDAKFHSPSCSVQFSCSVVPNSLRPHGLQHARLPCPSPTPGAYSNSSPSSRWYHPTISSSVVPFSSHLQSFPAARSFPISQFFASGSPSIGVSALASALPRNIQDWFPFGLTGWIPTLLGVLENTLLLSCQHTPILPSAKRTCFITGLCLLGRDWIW